MVSETQGEPSASLIEAAKAAGYPLTTDRLARWHRNGLLPPPTVEPRRTGHGTISVYPKGTGKQLLALLSIHQKNHSLADVGFRLWLAGYPVSDRYSVDYLRAAARQYDLTISSLKEARARLLSDDEKTEHEAWGELGKIVKKRIDVKFVRRLRKRVGSAKFETFLCIILDVVTGQFVGFPSEPDDPDRKYDDSILRSALGINSIQARLFDGGLLWMKDPIEPIFVDVSEMFGRSTFVDILHSTPRNCINSARQEFWILIAGISMVAAIFEKLAGKKLPAFAGIREISELASARDLAWMLIAWCRMRQLPWAQDYPKILEALREAGFAPRSPRGEAHD